MTIAELLRERVGLDVDDLRGAAMTCELPVGEAAVNRLIAARLARGRAPVSSVTVQAQDGDVFTATVVARARFVPPIRLEARIDGQPDLPHDPVLRLRWSIPAAGPLSRLAGAALAFVRALPPGLQIDGERLAVDLRQLLAARGMEDVLRYVRSLRIHTRAGAFVVRIDAGVPQR